MGVLLLKENVTCTNKNDEPPLHFPPCLSPFPPSHIPSFKSTQTPNSNQRNQSPISSFSFSKSNRNALNKSLTPILSSYQQPTYVYPDPIPEFAIAEAEKFEGELRKKLLRYKDTFGDDIDAVVKVCKEIFSEFMHKEYGGPGTLLVEPFTDMLLALKDEKLPGAPIAARAALLWAQNYVDCDWDSWNSKMN